MKHKMLRYFFKLIYPQVCENLSNQSFYLSHTCFHPLSRDLYKCISFLYKLLEKNRKENEIKE